MPSLRPPPRGLRRVALLTAFAALGLPGAAPALGQGGTTIFPTTATVGIADQHAETFSDPLFTTLGMKYARLNLAWDAFDYDWQAKELQDWMNAAQAAGVEPLVILSQSRVPGRTRLVPTLEQYGQVIDRLRAAYPFVRDFAAWNEANHPGQPTAKIPDQVAAFYKILRSKCTDCRIAPASLLDNRQLIPYALRMRKTIRRLGLPEPRIWGLQNYSDVNFQRETSTRAFLKAVKGKVWLTESGGVVRATSPTASRFPQGAGYAAKVTRYMLGTMLARNPRIERIYFYNFRADKKPGSWDSGLVDAQGRPRPAYGAIRNWLVARILVTQGVAAATSASAPAAP